MRELTKSIMSFSWAMSVFGLRQMAGLLSPGGAAGAFEAVARATEGQLGPATRSTFRAGDDLQRRLVDTMFSVLTPGMWDPNNWMRMGAEVVQRTAQAGAGAVQSSARAASQAAAGAASGMAAGAGAAGGGAAGQPAGQAAGWGPMPPVGR